MVGIERSIQSRFGVVAVRFIVFSVSCVAFTR